MADEKQFEPTPSRLDRAKREGDVARSQQLGNVAAFGCALAAAATIVAPLGSVVRALIASAVSGRVDPAGFACACGLMLVPAVGAALGAVAAGMMQGSGLRFVALTIKPDRLSPPENLKRMFSRESVVGAARATVAFLCAGGALVPAFIAIYAAVLQAADLRVLAGAAWNGALRTAALVCIVGAVFAAADYGVQFARWRARLRMSFEEAKRDQKEHDGDPLARGRRRAFHRQLSRGSLRKLKDAALVVTNPTHVAVALEYRPPEVPVPRVLVRAADESAIRVRRLAAGYGIPLVENVMLARALYASAKNGEFIPRETYTAVAEIVSALVRRGVLQP